MCQPIKSQAFDSVYRNALWLNLHGLGINGKMLRIIRGIYKTVKSCVKQSGQFSDFFDITIGLRQGEIMSPILFALFLEDLELH